MVIDGVPKETIGLQLNKRATKEWAASQIECTGHVAEHPRLRRAPRVGLSTKVEEWHDPIGVRDQILSRSFVGFDETKMQRICRGDDLTNRFLEDVRIERTYNLDAFCDVVAGILRIERLGEPNAELCLGQE